LFARFTVASAAEWNAALPVTAAGFLRGWHLKRQLFARAGR
jgi:hypothetical protein